MQKALVLYFGAHFTTLELAGLDYANTRHLLFHFSKVTGMSSFGRLSKVAKLVLVLPHSNADAERVFSVVGLNKTKTRNRLALEGTLSSILTIKMAGLGPEIDKWEPPASVVKASAHATEDYNKQHRN